ncbi:MAG: N-acetylneuraminate synthase family protein, partial [Aliarcobacter cryaerophilus]
MFDHARKIDITCFSTPFDETAVDLLEDLNVPAYKVASFEATDLPLIKYISSTKKPLIMSTGMANFEEIEEILIEADVEYEIIEKAMNGLPSMISRKELRHRLVMLFEHAPNVDLSNIPKPYVRLIIGVNGAGKTTTIAKLAAKLKKEGQSVILGAGDTFRAAAIEQLDSWAKK